MDLLAASDPVWTTVAAELQRSVAVAMARLLRVFPGRSGSCDEDADHSGMVAYRGTRHYERPHAASQLCRKRVVSHSDGDGQKHGAASGVFGPGRMHQRWNSRGESDSPRPTGNNISAIGASGGYRTCSASRASQSFCRPDSQLVL